MGLLDFIGRAFGRPSGGAVQVMDPNLPTDVQREFYGSPISSRGWDRLMTLVSEPFQGAWQQHRPLSQDSLATFGCVFACITRIAQDVSKMRMRLVEQGADGLWRETTSPAFSPVLTKPNSFQNRIQFFESWMVSKLTSGNAYVLKERDGRGVVTALYVLDPRKVAPLVTDTGDVYYRIGRDNLSGVTDASIVVPSTEIIHDRINALYHPLCGISPIAACAMAANNGMQIQSNSSRFFQNYSRPAGILVFPGTLTPEQAAQIKEQWEENYGGANTHKTAVLGGGLDYKAISTNAVDAQLIEQLQWDQRDVCTAFHVPGYMVGVGEMPKYDNIDALQQKYYTQCLQIHIEGIELCLDEGLGLTAVIGKTYGTEFDLDDLLRMDQAAMAQAEAELVKGSIKAPNEARARLNLPPKPGGDAPLAQQQQFSLEALAKRDAKADPFQLAPTTPAAPPPTDTPAPTAGGKDLLALVVRAKLHNAGVADARFPVA